MLESIFLDGIRKEFRYYQSLAEKAMSQVPDDKLSWSYNEDSNSIAVIVKHLSGNMLSRWTDFLSSDGEKEWRKRDSEFENELPGREELMKTWNKGWDCFWNTVNSLQPTDLEKTIYIRNQGHSVSEALNRQLAHYSYHVGQIVFLSKMLAENGWNSLSIPKNKSADYNAEKFSREKSRSHFTDDILKKD